MCAIREVNSKGNYPIKGGIWVILQSSGPPRYSEFAAGAEAVKSVKTIENTSRSPLEPEGILMSEFRSRVIVGAERNACPGSRVEVL